MGKASTGRSLLEPARRPPRPAAHGKVLQRRAGAWCPQPVGTAGLLRAVRHVPQEPGQCLRGGQQADCGRPEAEEVQTSCGFHMSALLDGLGTLLVQPCKVGQVWQLRPRQTVDPGR